MREKMIASELELVKCADSVAIKLQENYDEIFKTIYFDLLHDKKVNFETTVRLMLYPLAITLAERIVALMSQVPSADRSKFAMETLNHYQQLMERMVNDSFVMLKELDKEHAH